MFLFKGAIGLSSWFSSVLALTIVLLGHFVGFGFGDPVTFTNAASELKPRQVDPSSFWIGSHTLNFTPNPFLIGQGRSSRQNPVESSVVTSILPSPSSSTTEIPRQKKGRKVKRRRRPLNKNSKVRNPTRRNHKKINQNQKVVPEMKVKGQVGIRGSRRLGRRRLNSLNQSEEKLTSEASKLTMITTPEPIIAELNPESSQISMDFARVHPENLTPTYFRNIIVKAMMDRLVGAATITHFVPSKSIQV